MACTVSRTGRHLQRYNKGCRLVVGCIPYRYKNGNDGAINNELEVLVISSQKSQGMMFPKGGWELDESVDEAASRESLEEAGVLGNVESQLGKWSFKSKSCGIYREGYMFPLLVTEQLEVWPEKNVRQRIWMTVAEAREVCLHGWMKEALDILVDRLKSQQHKEEEEEALGILVDQLKSPQHKEEEEALDILVDRLKSQQHKEEDESLDILVDRLKSQQHKEEDESLDILVDRLKCQQHKEEEEEALDILVDRLKSPQHKEEEDEDVVPPPALN